MVHYYAERGYFELMKMIPVRDLKKSECVKNDLGFYPVEVSKSEEISRYLM